MPRSFSMRGVQGAAERAVRLAREHLLASAPGSRVHDVQDDPRFQHRGVDLLWELPSGEVRGVEVKGDRKPQGRNYFLELISNLERNTPGCFLYSEADLLLYVFLATRELHLLPLREVREWFLSRAKSFPLRHAFTQTGPVRYTTVGAVVPVRQLLEALPSVQRVPVAAPRGSSSR